MEATEPVVVSPTLDMPARHALRVEDFYPRLHRAMAHARVDRSDKVDALKRLSTFAKSTEPPTSATKTD